MEEARQGPADTDGDVVHVVNGALASVHELVVTTFEAIRAVTLNNATSVLSVMEWEARHRGAVSSSVLDDRAARGANGAVAAQAPVPPSVQTAAQSFSFTTSSSRPSGSYASSSPNAAGTTSMSPPCVALTRGGRAATLEPFNQAAGATPVTATSLTVGPSMPSTSSAALMMPAAVASSALPAVDEVFIERVFLLLIRLLHQLAVCRTTYAERYATVQATVADGVHQSIRPVRDALKRLRDASRRARISFDVAVQCDPLLNR